MASLKNVNLSTLRLLEAEDLADLACVARLENLADDPVFDLEPGEALDFYEQLSGIFEKYRGELEKDQEAYSRLSRVLWKLSWKALSAMGTKVRKVILGENVVYSLMSGIDIKANLQKILAPYETRFAPDKEQRREWVYALENNQERLGNQPVVIEGQTKTQATLQNWLKAYNVSQTLTNERGKFNQINFLNTHPSVKLLQAKEKAALSTILELYDWLLFPPPGREVLPEEPAEDYMIKQKFTLPQMGKATAPPIPKQPLVSDIPALAPLPQKPRVAATSFKIEFEEPKLGKGLRMGKQDIKDEVPETEETQEKPKPRAPLPPPPPPQPKPVVNPIKSKEQFNPSTKPLGAVGTGHSGVNIDQKLEELKKKAQRKN